jgi:hypothetical protein
MPTNLDFNSSKDFRNKILSRTLPVDNGPMSQTESSYSISTPSDFPNIDQPPVDANRTSDLTNISKINLYKPDEFFIREDINTLPRRANLSLYPYFTSNEHSYVGILTNDTFTYESELMKFAAWNIKENPSGPFYSRVQQNLEASTVGRVRLIDALNGNLATATNIVTGKEPLVEANNKITVASSVLGKGIDFLQTVTGVEFPWSEIPGDYLSNPANPIDNDPTKTRTTLGALNRDILGSLGSIVGIQRNPNTSRKPSDLFIEYMGSGQKQALYDNISYSKYAPNYTTTARSQNSSKVFNFVDSIAQNINKFFGADAPDTISYIGDDRGNDVKYAMSDFNDRPIRSAFYLGLLFDPVQARLFERERNITEGGGIGGKLTWISTKSKNKLGANNKEWGNEQGGFADTKSTGYIFRDDSILGVTQQILETLPTNGSEMRSHVANVIDQTSRIFKDGDIVMSKGSAIKYVDKFGEETGVEYCRAWTKDRSHMNYSDTMKRTANIRKFDGSVMGGGSRPWNINIAPMSNGNGSFDGSTNMFKKGDGFYAKKYMFSIENLAWKSSNLPGYTYSDLPYCERGNNGGRVMWFPPYDLKVSEQNSAKWDANSFLGRPEPIYTYQNTERNGTISFKVVVDHPSILNLLVREHFKSMTDEESENYINAFFGGCEEIDFYDLITKYTTITPDDAKLIQDYLHGANDPDTITKQKYRFKPVEINDPPITQPTVSQVDTTLDVTLKYLNDRPTLIKNKLYVSPSDYNAYYGEISRSGLKDEQITELKSIVNQLVNGNKSKENVSDLKILFGKDILPSDDINNLMNQQSTYLGDIITKAGTDYNEFTSKIEQLKTDINSGTVSEVTIHLLSSTSAIADIDYNFYLSLRRSHSVLKEILGKLTTSYTDKWVYDGSANSDGVDINLEYSFKELGFDKEGVLKFTTKNKGENYTITENTNCGTQNFFNEGLRKVAPLAFSCRQTQVTFVYTKVNQTQQNIPSGIDKKPAVYSIDPDNSGNPGIEPNRGRSKPPLDAMKYIVMKTLSECYYFKKLEETDPVVFTSLKEKFKYFHPSFHSTTPEGLNSRLTFLLQCVRPGDTIPIKGVNSNLDLRARNTSFGPPPICVLRIGDFYHSKVLIKDVNIGFEESPWDLNPEGIGIQPMIANVVLQIVFIGGQGIEKPVNWLQNALTSNFYANTEMYDPRSIGTNETIGGVDQTLFTKKFLEEILNKSDKKPSYIEPDTSNKVSTGTYIGELVSGASINYNVLVDDIFRKTQSYINSYQNLYNQVVVKYGTNVSSILLSPNYRTNNKYNIFNTTSNTPGQVINLFGLYEKGRDMFVLTSMFENKLKDSVNSENLLQIFGFDKVIPTNAVPKANNYLKEYLISFVTDRVGQMTSEKNIASIEDLRNELIKSLDKANFVIKYGYDAKLDDTQTEATKADLSGFTYNLLYSEYNSCIDYIVKNSAQFYDGLDTSINYNNAMLSLSTSEFTTIMKSLLYPVDSKTFIKECFGKDQTTFNSTLTDKIESKYKSFVKETKSKLFKFSKFTENNNKNLNFNIILPQSKITDSTIVDEIIKLNKTPNDVIKELNYYRK